MRPWSDINCISHCDVSLFVFSALARNQCFFSMVIAISPFSLCARVYCCKKAYTRGRPIASFEWSAVFRPKEPESLGVGGNGTTCFSSNATFDFFQSTTDFQTSRLRRNRLLQQAKLLLERAMDEILLKGILN